MNYNCQLSKWFYKHNSKERLQTSFL